MAKPTDKVYLVLYLQAHKIVLNTTLESALKTEGLIGDKKNHDMWLFIGDDSLEDMDLSQDRLRFRFSAIIGTAITLGQPIDSKVHAHFHWQH